MIEVRGYRILVEQEELERKHGDLVIIYENDAAEQAAIQYGTVLGIGDTCWTNEKGEPMGAWCAVGDKVIYAKHAGRTVVDPTDDKVYQIMLDTDILAVIKESE